MAGNDPIPLKDAINKYLEAYKLKVKISEQSLKESWRETMGNVIANHTLEIFLKNRTLHVRVDSAPMRQEMGYFKDKIVKRLNQKLGEEVISDLVLR